LTLKNQFSDREELIEYVRSLAPWAEGNQSIIRGWSPAGKKLYYTLLSIAYATTGNYGDGRVSRLSPYIHHGVLSLNEVRNHALTLCKQPEQIIKFIQELAWRDFWQRALAQNPEWAWKDIEPYKTGFTAEAYADLLPEDIAQGRIDSWVYRCIYP
jgi:deoxyribodipyrimidine photo-lyase